MSESFDLSFEGSDDDANISEEGRRNSIDLDLLQQRHDNKSLDSLMLEVSNILKTKIQKCILTV